MQVSKYTPTIMVNCHIGSELRKYSFQLMVKVESVWNDLSCMEYRLGNVCASVTSEKLLPVRMFKNTRQIVQTS